jgi:pimeloyl-ACP methyl ester carboxylesterase
MTEGTITTKDGRTVSYIDFGRTDHLPVLWCHGAPSCAMEAAVFAAEAERSGLRLIGIDRPGYGQSTPQPGRTIGAWPHDALALADHLGIDRFVTVGLSTGGAHA